MRHLVSSHPHIGFELRLMSVGIACACPRMLCRLHGLNLIETLVIGVMGTSLRSNRFFCPPPVDAAWVGSSLHCKHLRCLGSRACPSFSDIRCRVHCFCSRSCFCPAAQVARCFPGCTDSASCSTRRIISCATSALLLRLSVGSSVMTQRRNALAKGPSRT